jgi:hypothetical protein
MIEQLPSLEPDIDRNARTLARCHDKLNRRRADVRAAARWTVERNALLGFGAIYLSLLAHVATRVFFR